MKSTQQMLSESRSRALVNRNRTYEKVQFGGIVIGSFLTIVTLTLGWAIYADVVFIK
jgi:hypothetical protein